MAEPGPVCWEQGCIASGPPHVGGASRAGSIHSPVLPVDLLLGLAIVAVGFVLLFDFTNGFHDAANIVATVIASWAMTPLQAVMVAGVFEFPGPLLGGTAVANSIGGFVNISDLPPLPAVTMVLAGLTGAICWNFLTWRLGLPSSSSHALVGGLVGAVWVASGHQHVV